MFFNSIRWRLQLWYGVILFLVLAGFGFTAYQLESGRQLRRIDGELQRRVNSLAESFRPARPPKRDDRERPPISEPRPERDFPDEPPERIHPPRLFHPGPRQAALFDETDTNGFYFVIRSRDGKELARSTNAPAMTRIPHRMRMGPQPPRTRGIYREMIVSAPPGEIILVGRSMQSELAGLHRVAWRLAGVGGVILIFGLAGGWWLASRAIRPIETISETAVKISAGDLSRRINVADAESELGRLAAVLNSTFARLEAAFAQQQQFTSDAAHELRTPISVMLTQTQSALNRERGAAEYRETIEACERSAQRMRRLIESLLELARLDAGQETMRRTAVDLARIGTDCVEAIRPMASGRGISIQTEFAAAECLGDAERLGQVITNLLANAVHYNKDGGEIKIATRRENEFAVMSVSDTGNGIAPEHLPRVFERFYRADAARTSSQGRTGLGLAISKAIMDAHGGSIEVSSRVGEGTTFTVRLPVS
ncbi:MAG TPA: ATP-binding protein [Verrucomicrobiae bacterium]|nr:ATP-binding protein [Verrucomicrobiae bacterium]